LRQKSIALASRSSIFADWFLVRSRIDRECALLLKYPDLAPPLVAQQLLVSGEDHRHGWHPGFDIVAILRAVWRRLFFGSREGGSTIEQQLVRTITGRYERTFCRKLREIFLAMLVAAHFKVKAIPRFTFLSLLRQAMNGYREACQRLELVSAFLTMDEAAALVARLKYPEPRVPPSSRTLQIHLRGKHLLRLYRRHLHDGIYEHLNGTTVHSGTPALGTAQSVPLS